MYSNLDREPVARITKSIGISQDNWDMIISNEISNVSGFVNELIEDALFDRAQALRLFTKKLNKLKEEAQRLGYTMNIELYEVKDGVKTPSQTPKLGIKLTFKRCESC